MLRYPTKQSYRVSYPSTCLFESVQKHYPNVLADAIPGQHFHFIQVPHLQEVNRETCLSKGCHIIICFDRGFKTINKCDVRNSCLARLHKLEISLGTKYSNPLEIGSNSISKYWVGFIKVHLKKPHIDGVALPRRTCAFTLESEDGENGHRKDRKNI